MIKVTEHNLHPRYPLTAKDLSVGQYAEASNGTSVLKLGARFGGDHHQRIVNVQNGVGGYTPNSRFRLLLDSDITLTTNSQGMA